jgi:hypothetical protein
VSTYNAPIPGNVGAAQTALLAKRAYQEALARINQRRSGTLRQYGYLGDIDPETGTLGGLRVDPNNPYGQLQQTLELNADEHAASEDALLGRGLRGGLARQQEARLRKVFGGRKAALGASLLATLGGLQEDQTSAKQMMNAALYQAQLDATRNAIGNNEFSPANLGPVTQDDDPVDTGPPKPGEPVRSIPAGRPGYGNPPKTLWGGKYRTRDDLIRFLVNRRVSPSEWARKHPAEALRLGISAKPGGNQRLINKLVKRR